MVRYLFRIGYIGTRYRGLQKLHSNYEEETVQGAIEHSITTLEPRNSPVTVFASRTDKGVHAIMNAFHVDLEHKLPGEIYQPHFLRNEMNLHMVQKNHEIVIKNVSIVPETFHARFHAKWRSYYYRLAVLKPQIRNIKPKVGPAFLPISEINRCHSVPSELNTSIVKHIADMYCGEHDFTTFTKGLVREPWKNSNRFIDECRFYESPNYQCIDDPQYSNITMWEFYIKSRAFLYHQVRKLLGAALSAGLGLISLSDVQQMLDEPNPDSYKRCYLPSPGGLYLAHIQYDKKDLMIKDSVDTEEKGSISS